MTEKHNIGGSLPVQVTSWGHRSLSIINSDANKIKIIDTHPIRPLVVSVDGDGRINVWDFNVESFLMSVSVSDILNNILSTATAVQTNAKNTSELFFKQRMSSRCSGTFRSSHRFNEQISASVPHSSIGSSIIKPKGVFNIHQLSFVDSATVNVCGEFYPGTRILLVCDHQVIVYDYCTRMGFTVSEVELTKSPISAEFLGPNFLAIGCADGAIRVWDTRSRVVVRTLGGHNKGPVGVLRTVPLVGGNCSNSASTANSTRVRLVSFGADGVVLIWDLCVSVFEGSAAVVDVENSTSNGLPTARLKESLGVATTGSFTRGNVQYDAETNSLLICTGDRRIKIWDLGEVRQAQAQQKAQSIQQAKTAAAKRQSVLLSVVGGSGRDGHYADIFGISCVATVKPGDKRDRRIEVASFAAINSPLFPADSFILCSKTTSVGVYKSRESHAGDDKSERSSVAASSTEKSQRLQLLQEFSLTALMEKFVSTHSLSEGVRDVARCSVLKVYSLRVHAAQPHVVVLATSIGVVVLALPALPSGALSGCHPCWGPTKLLFINNSVRKVIMDSAAAGGLDRSSSRVSMSDHLLGGPLSPCEVSVEVTSELSLWAETASGAEVVSSRSGSVLGGKRMSFNPPNIKRLGAPPAPSETLSSRPTFHPSPSGAYCALVWRDTMLYLVLRVGDTPHAVPSSSAGRSEAAMVEVDRGFCSSFGWVGSHDCYLIKTPPYIAPIAAPKAKRSSIMGGLFGGEKETKKLFHSELLLFQCAAGETHVRRLDLDTQSFCRRAECAVTDMQSGPLVHFNLAGASDQAQRKVAPIAAGETGSAGPVDSPSAVAEGDNSSLLDVEKAERDLLAEGAPPRASLQSRFYCLVSSAEARRLETLSLMAKIDGKKQKKSKSSKDGVEEAAISGQGEVLRADDSGNSLWAVGPVMAAVDAVRWDHCAGRCAVLMGQDTVSILQLTVDSTNNGAMALVAVATLNLSPPVSSFQNIFSLLWDRHWLLVATSSGGHLVFDCEAIPPLQGVSVEANKLDLNCSAPWGEVLGVHHGNIYSYYRDGSIKASPMSCAPLIVVAALLVGRSSSPPEIDLGVSEALEWTQRMSRGDSELAVALLKIQHG